MVQSRFSIAIHEFFRWWGGELRALLPRGTGAGRGPARRLVVAVDGARPRLLLERGGQAEVLAEAAEAGDAGLIELAGIARARRGLPTGLRLGAQDCFARSVELPAQAEADFGRMLDLDMERTTPFRAADVLTAHYIAPDGAAARGKRLVRHLVVKRRTLEPRLEGLRALGIEPAFADCWSEDRRGGLPVNFLAARTGGAGRGAALTPLMVGLGVALSVSAVAILFIRHQGALDALDARTAAARAEAGSVRLAVEASQTASTQIAAMQNLLRQRVPLARVIEELTAIMPDSAWVADLRIDGETIEFTGFAKSAASLVPLLEDSPLFAEAGLTSPVMFDNTEDKERFSLRMKLSQGGSAAVETGAKTGGAL